QEKVGLDYVLQETRFLCSFESIYVQTPTCFHTIRTPQHPPVSHECSRGIIHQATNHHFYQLQSELVTPQRYLEIQTTSSYTLVAPIVVEMTGSRVQ
ncbi:hypothetical protein F442_16002, partial [Phytophthora nicotianae P10297]